ncbi:MAG: endonuclease III [Gemmatimonadetes bacterium]|nr:endonuclease III [Gemmatimonadota bacterium]
MPTMKAQRERMAEVLDRLKKTYPDVGPALNFTTPFELLVATILSAQCTDKQVNVVTESLFRKYPSPSHYLDAAPEALEADIFTTGFYRNKAANIRKCCRSLVDNHGGEVPSAMEDLTNLAGVGRKTANVVRGNAFGIPGIAVDTHVKRLSGLLGFTKQADPDRIERDLMKFVPESDWTGLGHLLASHGRKTCVARRPKCDECVLSDLCPSAK